MDHGEGCRPAPPRAWADLIEEHDPRLSRVRMLWRRGGGHYRPLVPLDVDIEELQTTKQWEAHELAETHFGWFVEDEETPEERRNSIENVVGELWKTAEEWTNTRGGWCDFQLVGYSSEDEILFESGRRYGALDAGSSGARESREQTRNIHDWEEERWRHRELDSYIEARMKGLVGELITERDTSFRVAMDTLSAAQSTFASVQQSIDAVPKLLNKASEAMSDGIDFQREQVQQMRDEQSGRTELRARAFKQIEETERWKETCKLIGHAIDAGIANLLPFANKLVDVVGNINMTVFPEFRCAQQAMAYLVESMTVTQLKQLWEGNMRSVAGMMGLLDEASRMPNERDALEHIGDLVRVLRSEEFDHLARPEEQMAARYIIGRRATYRATDLGEDDGE